MFLRVTDVCVSLLPHHKGDYTAAAAADGGAADGDPSAPEQNPTATQHSQPFYMATAATQHSCPMTDYNPQSPQHGEHGGYIH